MDITQFPASDRGHFDFGWLNTYHTFSFGEYQNPNRIRFGALRVLNDDTVDAGQGFGTHPHDNMEIISIPTSGVLAHRDSMGHEQLLHAGEVQVMSAGTGLTHSEYNGSQTDPVKFFQIWIFPEKRNIAPRYDQREISRLQPDVLTTVVGPQNHGSSLWINQQAWISMAPMSSGGTIECAPMTNNSGVFVFVVEGEVSVAGNILGRRDAIGLSNFDVDNGQQKITATVDSQIIVIDVPML